MMVKASPLSRNRNAAVAKLRSRRNRFIREDRWQRDGAMREIIDQAWPLLAAAAVEKRMPTDFKIDGRDKAILYRLAHPNPFYYEAIDRQARSGTRMSDAQRQAHYARLQEQADQELKIFDTASSDGSNETGMETRRYLAAATAKKRYELLEAYHMPTEDAFSKGGKARRMRPVPTDLQKKVDRHRRRWMDDDKFQALYDLYALREDLKLLSPKEIEEGFHKFGAGRQDHATRHLSHVMRASTLATCIAVAEPLLSTVGLFRIDERQRIAVAQDFTRYCNAVRRASLTANGNRPSKFLIRKSF